MQHNSIQKIGIVGAGAMGSLFAHYLMKANQHVVLYDIPTRVAALGGKLSIRLIDGTLQTIEVNISDDPKILHYCDIIFMFVKSYATRQASENIAQHIPPHTILVTLQNGLGNKEILAEIFPTNAIVYGATTIGAHIDQNGVVSEGGRGTITIGSSSIRSLEQIYALLQNANLSVEITHNPDEALWKKAIINAAINPLGALAHIPNGKIIESEHLRVIQEHIVREAVQVAEHEHIELSFDEMLYAVREVCTRTAHNRCSMLQDLDAGRRTEIKTITGHIIKTAHKHGIHVPYNEVIFALIEALEEQKKTGVAPGVT